MVKEYKGQDAYYFVRNNDRIMETISHYVNDPSTLIDTFEVYVNDDGIVLLKVFNTISNAYHNFFIGKSTYGGITHVGFSRILDAWRDTTYMLKSQTAYKCASSYKSIW